MDNKPTSVKEFREDALRTLKNDERDLVTALCQEEVNYRSFTDLWMNNGNLKNDERVKVAQTTALRNLTIIKNKLQWLRDVREELEKGNYNA